MGCAGYKDLLSRYIDGELSKREREELLAHLQHCSKCSHALAKYRQVEALLANPSRETTRPNPAVRDRVLGAIRAPGTTSPAPPARRQRPLRRIGAVAFASATLVAIVLLAQNQGVWLGNLFVNSPPPTVTPDPGATALASKAATTTSMAVRAPAHLVGLEPPAGELTLDQPLVARFDVAMQRSSVEEAWEISPPIPGSFIWSADNEVTFQPYNLGYLPGITYTLTISDTAHGESSGALSNPISQSWTTRPAPHLAAHSPAEFASGVLLTDAISLTFDRPMQRAAVEAAFSLSPSLPLAWQWQADDLGATVSPGNLLRPAQSYVATLSHAAHDQSGVSVGRDLAWRFSTVASPQVDFAAIRIGSQSLLNPAYVEQGTYALTYTATQIGGELRFDLYRASLAADSLAAIPTGDLLASYAAAPGADLLSSTVGFSLPAPGNYLLVPQIAGDELFNRTTATCLIVANDTRLIVERVGAQVLFWATAVGQPLPNQTAQVLAAHGEVLDSGATDAAGSYLTTLNPGVQPFYAVLRDGPTLRAVLPLDSSPAPASGGRLFIYTDQPAYAAVEGSKVSFKAHLLLGDSSGYRLPATSTGVAIMMRDMAGVQLASSNLRPDGYGAVSGAFTLAGLPGGWYTLTATALDQQAVTRFYVQSAAGWQLGPPTDSGVAAGESTSTTSGTSGEAVSTANPRGTISGATPAPSGTTGEAANATSSGTISGATPAPSGTSGEAANATSSGTISGATPAPSGTTGEATSSAPSPTPFVQIAAPQSSTPPPATSLVLDYLGYVSGGVVTLRVTLPTAPATPLVGLLTLRHEELVYRQVVQLAAPEQSFDLPLDKVAPLTVAELRLTDGTHASTLLTVSDHNPLLDLDLSLPTQVHPGSPTTLTVTLRDGAQPVAGSVSLLIASQRSLADLPGYFYPTSTLPQPLPPGEGRNVLGKVAYWNANVVITGSGVLTIPFQLPDDATGDWWVTARAVTADWRMGQQETRLNSVQPVELTPLLTDHFVQGDRSEVGLRLRNSSGQPLHGRVTLSSDGLSLLDLGEHPAAQAVTLAPYSSSVVLWRVEWRRSGKVGVVFDFAADDDSSRELGGPLDASRELSVLVRPVVAADQTALAGVAEESQPITFTVPSEIAADLSSVEIEVAPSLAAALVGSSGAVAATPADDVAGVGSRAASGGLISHALGQLGYSRAGLDATLVSRALPLIYTAQLPDGSWPQAGATDRWTTLLTLHNLARLRDAGVTVDGKVTARAGGWLRTQLPRLAANELAYSYYILSLYAACDLDEVRPLLAAELDPFGLAMLTLSLDRLGDRAAARLLARRLSAQAVVGKGMAYWQAAGLPDALTTATVLSALAVTVTDDANIGRAVRWLLAQRVASRWGVLPSDAAALDALTTYAVATNDGQRATPNLPRPAGDDVPPGGNADRPARNPISYRVYLNDALLNEPDDKLNGDPLAATTRLRLPLEQVRSGVNVLRLVSPPGLPLYYNVTVSSYPTINASFNASDTQAGRFAGNPRVVNAQATAGLSIERSYEWPRSGFLLQPGDEVLVTLTATTQTDLAALTVSDYLPAGFTLVEAIWPGSPRQRRSGNFGEEVPQVSDDSWAFLVQQGRADFYQPAAQAGRSYRFSYRAQVTSSGIFVAPPASVGNTLTSNVARSESAVFTIAPQDQ